MANICVSSYVEFAVSLLKRRELENKSIISAKTPVHQTKRLAMFGNPSSPASAHLSPKNQHLYRDLFSQRFVSVFHPFLVALGWQL